MKMKRALLLLLLTLSTTSTLVAQLDSTTVFTRVFTRRMEALAQDPQVKEMEQTGGIGGLGAMNASALNRLDDGSVVLFAQLLSSLLTKADMDQCALAMSGNGEQFFVVAQAVSDSVEAEGWSTLIERLVWISINEDPPGVTADPAVVNQAMIAIMLRGTDKERELIDKSQVHPEWAACLLTPWVISHLARKPPASAAPLIRGLLAIGLNE